MKNICPVIFYRKKCKLNWKVYDKYNKRIMNGEMANEYRKHK